MYCSKHRTRRSIFESNKSIAFRQIFTQNASPIVVDVKWIRFSATLSIFHTNIESVISFIENNQSFIHIENGNVSAFYRVSPYPYICTTILPFYTKTHCFFIHQHFIIMVLRSLIFFLRKLPLLISWNGRNTHPIHSAISGVSVILSEQASDCECICVWCKIYLSILSNSPFVSKLS